MTFTALKGKTIKRRKPARLRVKKTGAAAIPTEKGHDHFQRKFHIDVEPKECHDIIKGYVTKRFDKRKAQAILKNDDWRYNRTHVAAFCYWTQTLNLPVGQETSDWFKGFFEDLIQRGSKTVKEEIKEEKKLKNVYVPTIQDRMKEQLSDIIGELEVWLDNISDEQPKFFDWFKAKKIPQMHLAKIRSFYELQKAEFELLSSRKCPDELKEGYTNLSKKQIKNYVMWFDSLFTDLDAYANMKKATRKTRTPKPKSADKLVKSLKFKKEDTELKIASVNPINIIGSTCVFSFNTKYRILSVYISDGPISVKGTTLTNFNPEKSFSMKLRKPEDVLPNLMKGTMSKVQKMLDGLTTKKYEATGRMNADTVILKAS